MADERLGGLGHGELDGKGLDVDARADQRCDAAGFHACGIDHAVCAVRTAGAGDFVLRAAPLDLLRRFYFDSVVFEPQALAYLARLVGPERVFLGTDAPFDMGDENPLKTLADAPGLTDTERAQIAGQTALRLLGEVEERRA